MLDNYLQQTTSADVIFQLHFFLALKGLTQNLKTMSQYLRDSESAGYYEEILGNIDNRKGSCVM